MTLFLQQVVDGLAAGAIYAALALALVLVHRATRIVNFAQGEMATFSVYVCWQMTVWGVPLYVAVLLTMLMSFVLGAAVFRLFIQPVLDAPEETIVVSCIGLFVAFGAICLWIWGSDSAQFPPLVPSFTTEAAIYAEYLKRVKPNAKVGILYLNTDFGQNFLSGFKEAIKGSNIQLLDAQPNNYSDPTVDTQLTNLKASGADTLLLATVPKPAAQAVRFAAESEWKPLIMITYAASSPVALKPAGVDNLQGVVTGQFMKPISSKEYADDPGVKRYLADYEQFKPRFDRGDTLGQMGYMIADGVVAVLQQMKQPTREAMLEAARHMKGVQLDLLLPAIKLTTNGKDDPFPIEAMQVFVFKGDGYVATGDPVSYEGKTPKL